MQRYRSHLLWILTAPTLIFTTTTSAQSKQALSESGFVDLFLPKSIAMKAQGAQAAQEAVGLAATEEMHGPRLKISGGRLQSNEEPANVFQPNLSPVDEVSVSIQQQLTHGISIEGGVFGNQKSASDKSFEDATQVGAKVALRVELLKNRGGQLDKAQLQLGRIRNERAATQTKIVNKQQEIAARKLFWDFIGNQESLTLTAKLEDSAAKQLADTEARSRLGVADAGEIARYRSQLQSRRAAILRFQHERELLWQAVQKQSNGIDPERYEFDVKAARQSEPQISECLAKVVSQKTIDPSKSLLSDNIAAYRRELDQELASVSRHASPSLAFVGSAQTTGVSDSYDDAFTRQSEDFKSGNYLGLEFSMPLGGRAGRTERAMLAAKRQGIEAQAEALDSELAATFRAMEKSLEILQKGLATQKENSSYLNISYREMRRKFAQGRVPLTLLINEQDALFQSELQEISFQKQIIHTLLDYFAVFSKFPCQWNQSINRNVAAAAAEVAK